MLEAKLAGEAPKRPEPVSEDAPVIDLMEALRRSVADVQERKRGAASGNGSKETKAAPAKSGSRPRRASARKSA
jgi:non-homologous end joining protein Ku